MVVWCVCVFLCLCLRLTGSLDFHQETVEFGPTHIFTQIYAPVTVHMISNGSVYSARNLQLTAVLECMCLELTEQ